MKKLSGRIPPDLDSRLSALGRALATDANVVALYLFGSRARGDHDALSDVDLALLLRDSDASVEDRYCAQVSAALGTDEVSLLFLDRVPVALVESALRDAKLLVSNDEARRLDFEAHAHLRYLDFQPYLERYDRELFEDLAARSRQ